ncbi:hypothetical protein Avbf_16427, partial [Armadillidium vulgare]
MAEENMSSFGIIDNCMFVGVLIISTSIGFFFSYKGNKSPEEFLLGNRSFKSLPVAMSLFTTYVSAIALLGTSGEAYANGMQLSMMTFGIMLAIIFSKFLILPILYPLKLMSINEGVLSNIWTVFQFFLMVIVEWLLQLVFIKMAESSKLYIQLPMVEGLKCLSIMNLSPLVRHTFFNTITMGFFSSLPIYTSEQVILQRICSVKTFKNAK